MGKKEREWRSEGVSLCELRKDIKEHLDLYRELVREPTHLCRKCGRVANHRENLCKPVDI